MDGLTIRTSVIDDARVATTAAAMQTPQCPFVTRSAAIRFALRVVAEDARRFVAAARKGAHGAEPAGAA